MWNPATFSGPTGSSIPFQYTYFIILFAGVLLLAVLFGLASPRGASGLRILCCASSTQYQGTGALGRSKDSGSRRSNRTGPDASDLEYTSNAAGADDVEMLAMDKGSCRAEDGEGSREEPEGEALQKQPASLAAAATTSASRMAGCTAVLKTLSRLSGWLSIVFSSGIDHLYLYYYFACAQCPMGYHSDSPWLVDTDAFLFHLVLTGVISMTSHVNRRRVAHLGWLVRTRSFLHY